MKPGSNSLHCDEVMLHPALGLEKYVGNMWLPIDETDTHVSTVQAPGIAWIKNIKVTVNGVCLRIITM